MTHTATAWPKLREMTCEQMTAWGEAESLARQEDLKDRTEAGLLTAQRNANERRKLIGASLSQAATLVLDANRALRRAALKLAGA